MKKIYSLTLFMKRKPMFALRQIIHQILGKKADKKTETDSATGFICNEF